MLEHVPVNHEHPERPQLLPLDLQPLAVQVFQCLHNPAALVHVESCHLLVRRVLATPHHAAP